MYLLDLFHEHAKTTGNGALRIQRNGNIAKWTFLDDQPAGLERLRLISLACAGRPFTQKIISELGLDMISSGAGPLRLEICMAMHHPRDGIPSASGSVIRGSGLVVDHPDKIDFFGKHRFRYIPRTISNFKAMGRQTTCHFFLGYGSIPLPQETTVFDYSDIWHLLYRFASLFYSTARLSNPAMVLEWIQNKGIRFRRFPKQQALARLQETLAAHLQIDTGKWQSLDYDFAQAWNALPGWQKAALLPVLDMVRHALDANPRSGYPLQEPLLALLHRPDCYCPQEHLRDWFNLLNELFPRGQFIVSLPETARSGLSASLLEARLAWPELPTPSTNRSTRVGTSHSIPEDAVALVQMDGSLPNHALMKISGYFKSQGRCVRLFKQGLSSDSFSEVWASCIFYRQNTQKHILKLRARYGKKLRLGGTGVNIEQRLPREMEEAEPDYDLYSDLGDRAIGFLTRGCSNNCAFCIVPRKEGTVRQVAELDDLLRGRKKLILLDDNILSHNAGPDLLAQMAERDIAVNFNQTLDLRLVTEETARLLRRVRAMNVVFSRPCLHFSLNNAENLEALRRKYELMGFRSRDNVEFICMYGYNTTLAEDVERFRFLRSLPGAFVFTQCYRQFPGAPDPVMDTFFGSDPDPLLDELVRIIFPQNMKSMEKYYRWISRLYAERFGRLHKNLVDTIFRYNRRDLKGRYLATVAGTKPVPF